MKAGELAEKLMEHPEAEVIVERRNGFGVRSVVRVSFGYYAPSEGGFWYGLHGLEDIEPYHQTEKAVLVE